MSGCAHLSRCVQDVCSIKLTKKKLKWKNGRESKSPKREVPNIHGTKWWLSMYPGGWQQQHEDYISVILHASFPVNVHITLAIEGADIEEILSHLHVENCIELPFFAFRNDVLSEMHRGSLSLTCSVTFELRLKLCRLQMNLYDSCDHFPTDFMIVIGDSVVEVHKHYLALISPVFHAIFTHDTIEAHFGQLIIKDFDFNIVEAAIDFCYGRGLRSGKIETIVGVLRFGDKYDIKSISRELEKTLIFHLNPDSFSIIAHYAFDCSRAHLMTKCAKYLKTNIKHIKDDKKFQSLPAQAAYDLLKLAFCLTTMNEVLDIAHEYRISTVIELCVERHFKSMTLDKFVTFVNYAWMFSCDKLKRRCAEFFNDHRFEITTMDSFLTLKAKIAVDVMKIAASIINASDSPV